jgi:hypothetical protein
MARDRYLIKEENQKYYVFMEGIRGFKYKIPLMMNTMDEAIVLVNCLEGEYNTGVTDGKNGRC